MPQNHSLPPSPAAQAIIKDIADFSLGELESLVRAADWRLGGIAERNDFSLRFDDLARADVERIAIYAADAYEARLAQEETYMLAAGLTKLKRGEPPVIKAYRRGYVLGPTDTVDFRQPPTEAKIHAPGSKHTIPLMPALPRLDSKDSITVRGASGSATVHYPDRAERILQWFQRFGGPLK